MNIKTLAGYALSVSSDTKYEAFSGEAWAKAAEVTLLGMGLVVAVLAILWLVLSISKLLFVKDAKKEQKENKDAPASVTATPEVSAENAATAIATADDGELIAVITAAVAAYRASEEGCEGADIGAFRVVSFKRAANGRAWNSNK